MIGIRHEEKRDQMRGRKRRVEPEEDFHYCAGRRITSRRRRTREVADADALSRGPGEGGKAKAREATDHG